MTPQALSEMLAQPQHAGIYHLPRGGQKMLVQAAEAQHYACLSADLGDADNMAGALAALGRELKFPDWYGANLDALHDCLTDLSWCEAPGYVLMLRGGDRLHAHEPEAFTTLTEVLGSVVGAWREQQLPFWVFFDLRADGLPTLPTLA